MKEAKRQYDVIIGTLEQCKKLSGRKAVRYLFRNRSIELHAIMGESRSRVDTPSAR